MNRHAAVLLGRVGVAASGAVVWELLSRSLGETTLPSLGAIGRRLGEEIASGEIFHHAGVTIGEAATGLGIGTAAGIILPVVLQQNRRIDEALAPLFAGAMGIPKLALAPLLTLWLGIGFVSKVAFVAAAVFFLVFFSMAAGLRAIDPTLVAVSRTMGARGSFLLRAVLLPSTLPFLFGSLKIAVPHAITIAVVGELIVSDAGLGHLVQASAAQADSPGIFAGVFVISLLVVALTIVLERVERRVLVWR